MCAADELQRRLAAVAGQLQACSEEAALQASDWRAAACAAAAALRGLQHDLENLHQALHQAQEGERRERRRAERDSLTALPNREGFDRRLHGALRQLPGNGHSGAHAGPQRLAVLFLDLDEFKHVNDSHGHAVGDALLRTVGQRLRRTMRAGDVVCRLGGDEFACLVDGPLGRQEVARLTEKLIQAVAAPVCLGDLQLSVRLSVGIALCPGDGDSAAELLQRADSAMFNAKRQQSGMAFFDSAAHSRQRPLPRLHDA